MVSTQRRIAALRWPLIFMVVLAHCIQAPLYLSDFEAFRDISICHEGFYSILYAPFFQRTLGLEGMLGLMFVFSGYLTALSGVPDYTSMLRRKCRTLLLPLVVWTLLGLLGYVLLRPFSGPIGEAEFILNGDLTLWFRRLLVEREMFMYQLWYVRDLVVLHLCLPCIVFFVRRCPKMYFAVLVPLAVVDAQLVLFAANALLYFSLGIAWAIHKRDCTGLADSLSWRSVLCAIACILAAAVWLGGERAQMLLMASAFPVMLAFFKLGAILATHRPTFGVLKTLGPQAFFLYCAHGPSLDLLLRWQLMPFFDLSSQAGLTASILVHTILLVCTCTVAGKCMERWYPRAYALLTGGRVAPPKGYIQR